MICHKLKLLYLHPAKTGGTSVETALLNYEIGHDTPSDHQRSMYAVWTKEGKQHWPYARIIREFPFLMDWKSMVTVRHPYDRMISEFRYQLAGNRKQYPSPAHNAKDINKAIANDSLWDVAWGWHMAPMTDYIGPETKIVRIENLNSEWESLGIGPLNHLNSSKYKIQLKLNEASKQKIQHYYAADFSRLGYEP